MEPEIIGAFIGALVAFLLGEVAARARGKREAIEHATLALALDLPEVLLAYTPTDVDTGIGSPWWLQRNRALKLLTTVRAAARWPVRRHRKIRRAVDDLTARVAAAELRSNKRHLLELDDLLEITTADLQKAVFGKGREISHLTSWYMGRGFQVGSPPTSPRWKFWIR